jgi:anti-sigma B factor antagonist
MTAIFRALKCRCGPPKLIVDMTSRGSVKLERQKDREGFAFAISRRDLEPGTTVIAVAGELDLASAPNLKWTLNDSIAKGAKRIVLDMSPVRFIDSTALGVLVGVHRSLEPGSRLAIAGADTDADVINIFELTGLDSTFDMFSTIDEALAWVRGSEGAAG